jgi:signal transduction histidine kinase
MGTPDGNNQTGVNTTVIDYLVKMHGLAYAAVSPELEIVWATPNFREVLVDSPQQIEGRLLPDVLWEFVGAEQALEQVLCGDSPAFMLERVNRLHSDGSTAYYRFLILPAVESRPVDGLFLVVEDTTAEGRLHQELVQDRNELRLTRAALSKANAELARLNDLKTLFLSIAAHDMRTPLTVIGGLVELMHTGSYAKNPQKQQEFLAMMRSQVTRLKYLIADFVELDRLEKGKFSIQPVRCDLKEVIDRVVHAIQDTAVTEGLNLSMELNSQDLFILADPARLEQILYNLLSNAIKYTPSGGHIQVRAWAEVEMAAFQVQDNGVGMEAEDLKNLFALYYRTAQAKESRISGTGLGLYIVKSLIDAHQGQIEVESQPGTGSTFTVRMPLVQN